MIFLFSIVTTLFSMYSPVIATTNSTIPTNIQRKVNFFFLQMQLKLLMQINGNDVQCTHRRYVSYFAKIDLTVC